MTNIDDRFKEFHLSHPHIFDLFCRFALQVKERGKKIGAKAIAERIRWEIYFEKPAKDEYKINNSFVSRYARLAVEKYPDLITVFNFRSLKS